MVSAGAGLFHGRHAFARDGAAPRHPFELAALGSAIIHGLLTEAHSAEWTQLDGASAARDGHGSTAGWRAVSPI